MLTMDTTANDLPPQAARLAPKLRALADQGVYFGTSSWKYEGWVGTIYSQDRYLTRGKFSKANFEADCLAECAAALSELLGVDSAQGVDGCVGRFDRGAVKHQNARGRDR